MPGPHLQQSVLCAGGLVGDTVPSHVCVFPSVVCLPGVLKRFLMHRGSLKMLPEIYSPNHYRRQGISTPGS